LCCEAVLLWRGCFEGEKETEEMKMEGKRKKLGKRPKAKNNNNTVVKDGGGGGVVTVGEGQKDSKEEGRRISEGSGGE